MKKNLLTLIVLSIISCFSISTVWAQTNCDGLDGGVPVGPDPAVFVLGETAAADIAATSIPDAGTTDYTFVVTTPFGTALDADGNPIQAVDADGNPVVDADGNPVFVEGEFIIGVTDDGSFDFNDDGTGAAFQVGVYNFTGFGFNQSELDAVGGLINGPLWGTVAGILGLDPELADQIQALVPASPNLGELLLLLDALSDVPQTIPSVQATIDDILVQAGGLLTLCYAISEAPYTVSVEEAAIECSVGTTSIMMGDTATGSGTTEDPYVICAQETFTVTSEGDFEALPEYPNPNVVWLIYTCTPTTSNPFEDDCAALLSLVGETGVIFGSGEASLFGQEPGTYQICPTIVPNEPELIIDPSCTGIVAGEACTSITILDAFGPECLCSDPENIPANDACADNFGVEVADGAINGPFGNLCASVDETTDQLPTGDFPVGFFDESLDNTVWFTFTGDGCTYHIYTSSNCGDIDLVDEGAYVTDGDTQMAVFTGEGCDALTLVASNEDDVDFGSAAGDYFAGVILNTEEGMEYSVMIDGYNGSFGFFCLNADLIECPVAAPANDECDAAIALDVTDGVSNGPFTNVGATGDDGDVPACFADASPDGANIYDNNVWFTFEGTGDIITLTTTNECATDTTTALSDTQLAIFDACGGVEVACNDDIDEANGNFMSSVTFATMAGMTYTVVVDGFYNPDLNTGASGEFCIDVAAEAVATCDANFGTVMAPANTAICAGEMSEAVMVMDAATEGYTSLFVVTEGESLVIVGLQETGEFDAAMYGNTETFYTVHAFNFADGDTDAILATVVFGETTGGDVAGLIADGVICASLDVAGTVFTTLAADDPACFTAEPLAVSEATTVEGDGTYTVSFSISGGEGDYTVDGEGSIADGVFTSADIACGTDFSFTVTDGVGSTATVAGEAPCQVGNPCDDNPITIVTDVNCDQQTGEFFVLVTVSGGFPSDDEGYTITGTVTNTNTAELGNPFTIGPLTDGGTYQVGLTDLAGCELNFQSDPVACTKCPDITLGDMPADAQMACDGAAVAAVLGGFTLDSDSVILIYAVHTSADDSAGDILAANDNGTFSFADLDGGEYYTTYYISAVAGIDADGDGTLNETELSNECTVIVAGTPIMFFAPIELTETDTECDNDTGEGSVSFSVTGGYPASPEGMANAATYSISGYTNLAVTDGEEFSISGLTNGDSWTVTAADNFCGQTSELTGISECIKTPVEWLSFTGETQNDGNFLKWVTATETQSHYFAVESSVDGTNFQVIATQDAAGESNTAIAYEYLDRDAAAGTTYYRITQYDFDGSSTQTDVLALTRGEVTFGIGSLQPIPANNVLTVKADFATATKAEVIIYTLDGKVVSNTQVDVTEGANSINLDVANIASGMYFITVSNGVETATDKFVKQ